MSAGGRLLGFAAFAGCVQPIQPEPIEHLTPSEVPVVTVLPLAYCADPQFASEVLVAEGTRAVFDLWDAETDLELFTEVGSCTGTEDVDVFLRYDPEQTSLVALTSGVHHELTVGGDPFLQLHPQAQVDAGKCTDGYGLEYLLAHEIGHVLGIRHSCEPDEKCTDEEAEALMSGVFEPCRTPLALNAWDREALAFATF